MAEQRENGVVSLRAVHSVDEAVARLQALLNEKSIKLFALIDHSGEAKNAGLNMPPTKLLIFGNPKGGTPLMLAAPSIALDLPLKLLVWEDTSGQTWISYNSPEFLQQRHSLPQNLVGNLAAAAALAEVAAKE